MADGGGRCLSDLSDDLPRHILFLAPDIEGASTAVLSRRWRWLWSTSGAVFLDSRSFVTGECSSPDQKRESLLRGAEKALAAAAARGPIRRLTFFIVEDIVYRFDDNLMEVLLSIPATRHVEELKIIFGRFKLSFGSLPSEALRELRLTGCPDLTASPPGAAATAFRMLVELHLKNCDVDLVDFQKIIDSAPRLSTLHLKSSTLCIEKYTIDHDDDDDDDDGHFYNDEQPYTIDDAGNLFGRLLIPAVSALIVEDCRYGYKASLELDVPRLQHFRYKGHFEKTNCLSLKSPASSNMIQVDLDLISDYYGFTKDPTPPRDSFRQFIQNFNYAKLLKLKLDLKTMDHLDLEDKAGQDELIGGLSFYHLDQLELEGDYNSELERSLMVMLASLLHSCPMVRDLRLKLRKKHDAWVRSSIDKEAGVHFGMSVNGFRNRRSLVSLGGEDVDNYYQAGIFPGLTGEHSFSCLQSHLKRVSLQFLFDEPNCLGVQLAKFFAENAMVLQEIHIDDGCHEMLEHVNPTVRRWIAKNDKISKQLNVKD